MSGVLPRHDSCPSFLLYVLVCTSYLLCASHTVLSYSRVKHLTRPVDDDYRLPTNYTSRLDLYVYSYHLQHGHLNTSKPSHCTATDPCLTLSDTNSIFKKYLDNSAPTRCLIIFHLVADPLLQCRVDAGNGISLHGVKETNCTDLLFLHRGLLLPGCELVSLSDTCHDEVFNYDHSNLHLRPFALHMQNIKLIIPRCSSWKPVISVSQSFASTIHLTLQNCVFVMHSLCRQVVSMNPYSPEALQFTMQNCTTELLPGTVRDQCYSPVFDLFVVSDNGTVMVNIRDSLFHGISSFRIIFYPPSAPPKSKTSTYFKVVIVNCSFLNLQEMYGADITFDGGESLVNTADVEIADVKVTNGRYMKSAFRVAGVRHVLIANSIFHISTGDGISTASGLEWRNNPDERSTPLTRLCPCLLHFINCTLMRSIVKASFSTRHSSKRSLAPFIILEGSQQPSQCKFSNLAVRDYHPFGFSTPVITTKHMDVMIDGNTDIK